MKRVGLLICFLSGLVLIVYAQGPESPTRGFLMTRVSISERTDPLKFPSTTPRGTLVYDMDTKSFWYWDGAKWVEKPSADKADTTNDHWKNGVGQLRLAYNANGAPRTAGAEVVFKDDGKVGIGTATPSAKLHVIGAEGVNVESGSSQLKLYESDGSDPLDSWQLSYNSGLLAFVYHDKSANTYTPAVHLDPSGKVGIGTESPTAKLHTNGFLRFENLPTSSSTLKVLGVTDNGNVSVRNTDDFFPRVITGNSGVDAISTAVTVTATTTSNNVYKELYTLNFTLDKESVLDVTSGITVQVHDASATNINSGITKLFGTLTEIWVFRNGARLVQGEDYTIANTGGSITFIENDYTITDGDKINVQWVK